MKDNNSIHRFIVPIGYTLSWLLGICLGVDFFNVFGHKDVIIDSSSTSLWFYSALGVYFAFLLECVFIFIDFGAVYKNERFNGKIFYVTASILFHFFITMWLVGILIDQTKTTLICLFTVWVVVFKLGISLLATNINFCLVSIPVRTLTSNRIK